MEVKIISEELIKPSSLTPQHLRTFRFSFFNQKSSSELAPLILFYPGDNSEEPRRPTSSIDLLKKSLSHTLARLYPLAGKLMDGDDLSIDCDDNGALFVQAAVNMTLTQILSDPNIELFADFLPRKLGSQWERVTNVQVNLFECGGIAIALSNTHVLYDGATLGVFLKEWAAAAKSDGGGAPAAAAPGLDSARVQFPPTDLRIRDLVIESFSGVRKLGNCVAKRFVFSGAAIEALRVRGASARAKNPTKVEAVTGLLWMCMVNAASRTRNDGQGRPSSFNHAVNIRRRTNPPLPDSSLGDLTWVTTSHLDNFDPDCTEDRLPVLVSKLRGAISKVDGNFLSQLRYDKDLVSKTIKEMCGVWSSSSIQEEVDVISCSSWRNFRFYDTDFGWGMPIWVTSAMYTYLGSNYIQLMDTKFGGGMEAWITLEDEVMAMLEGDHELLSYAAVNPSPLIMGDNPAASFKDA